MPLDLHELPKLRDSISYIYVEHAHVEQDMMSVVLVREKERIPIPVASLTCMLLGPGTTITHAAIKTMSVNGCMIIWCGEECSRFYASGTGETHSASNILKQAELCMNQSRHLEVAKRMYLRRFSGIDVSQYVTIQQLRGMEGIRVREAYRLASKTTGVKWNARNYKTDDWNASDPINKAISLANSILYSVCHASIVSLGYSPALGFIHTGKQLSFVYDIADLYKADVSIPAAFHAVGDGYTNLESAVRRQVRVYLDRNKLLSRIPLDIEWIFRVNGTEDIAGEQIGDLWTEDGNVSGGKNYGDDFV